MRLPIALYPKLLPVILTALITLSACTTNIVEKQALPTGGISVQQIAVEGGLHSNATNIHISKLESAIQREVGERSAALTGKPVDIRLIITRAEFVAQGTRALAGMLAGVNHLDVTVYLLEPGTKIAIGEFEIDGSYNPGGFGMFTDPAESAATAVAKTLVDKLVAAQ